MSVCPGCVLEMPDRPGLTTHSYYHASPECWNVYSEVLAAEYSDAIVFGQVHQLTVDSYAVQHAGGAHPDKSVVIHLVGLHLVLERGLEPPMVPPQLQRLAETMTSWPHFTPQPRVTSPTVFDVALAGGGEEHIRVVRAWSRTVWDAWSPHHATIAALL